MRTVMILIVMAVLACNGAAPAAWDEFIVIASDYQTLGFINVAQRHAPWTVTRDVEEVYQDAIARYHNGLYYVVNRSAGRSLQIVDPALGYQTIRQFSLGVGRNPRDIAFRSDGLAFVSCYDEAVLLKVDVKNEVVLGAYSTAVWADADGIPETSWILAVGDLLYINCERLDRNNWFVPAGGSCLLVFDMAAEQWLDVDPGTPQLDAIDLVGENPSCMLELSADRSQLRAGCTGWYGLLDGGVEVIDLASHTSLGFEITEAELGGDILDFETVGPCLAYAIVSDQNFHTSIRAYDRCAHEVEVVAQASGYVHADIAYDGAAYLYACDRTAGASGLRVYDAFAGQELTQGPIATGMAPSLVVLPIEESLVDVPGPQETTLRIEPPWPNPCNPSAQIRLHGPAGGTVGLGLYDLRGRRVRSIEVALDGQGRGLFAFDGRDGAGRPVASGRYQVVARSGSRRAVAPLVLVR